MAVVQAFLDITFRVLRGHQGPKKAYVSTIFGFSFWLAVIFQVIVQFSLVCITKPRLFDTVQIIHKLKHTLNNIDMLKLKI